MKKIIVIFILSFFIISCESKYPNYIELENGVYMKLLSFEESEIGSEKKEYASVSISIFENQNIIFRQYKEDVLKLEDCPLLFLIQHLSIGDSAIFKVASSKISKSFKPFSLEGIKDEYLNVNIKIHNYFSQSEYLASKTGFDKEMMEQLLLNKYLEEVNIKEVYGIYKQVINEGVGAKVQKGDAITIGYKGFFINRLKFDEVSGSTAFTFKYGTPGQVIKGLEMAIMSMREGEKSKIIIPSQLAFGEEGSSTLIVPSFTTVIYELEILKIN